MVSTICTEVLTRAVIDGLDLIRSNLGNFIFALILLFLINHIFKRYPLMQKVVLTLLPLLFKFILGGISIGILGILFAITTAGIYSLIYIYILLTSRGSSLIAIIIKIAAIPGVVLLANINLFTPIFIGGIGALIFSFLMDRYAKIGQLTLIVVGVIILLFPSTLGIAATLGTFACRLANVALGGTYSGIGSAATLFLLPLSLLKQKLNQPNIPQ